MTPDLAALVERVMNTREIYTANERGNAVAIYAADRDALVAAIEQQSNAADMIAEEREAWRKRAESLAAENARLTVERADSNDYVAWLTFRKKDGTHSDGRIRICDSDSPGAFKVYRAAPVSAVLESIDIANELAAKEQTWNAAMERAAEIADYYAEAMKSEAAQRAADQIRACKLPLPSPEDIA